MVSELAVRLRRISIPRLITALLGIILFLAILLAVGLSIYQDYGISWDEPTQVEMGIKNYRYVVKNDPGLLSWRDRYYGPFFENALAVLQSRGPSREMYLSRHLLTFLFFWAGVAGLYSFGIRLLKNRWLALLACAFLVLNPRIFADAFYNTKDIPFLVLYIFSLRTLLLWLDRPNLITTLVHGLFTAALLATRLPGLIIPALALAGIIWETIQHRVKVRRAAVLFTLYLVSSLTLTVAFWPALWPEPLSGLVAAMRMMSSFPHSTEMLYLGATINSASVPWHYILVWIGITLPLPTLIFSLVGLPTLVSGGWKEPGRFSSLRLRDNALLLAAFFAPLLAVILLRATLYDGWRHMYFLAAPLALIAAAGEGFIWTLLRNRLKPRLADPLAGVLLAVCLLPTLAWMIAQHPYQNLYFNRLAGANLRTVQQNFTTDYWGLAYRAGLEYILNNDPAERINVMAETEAGWRNAAIFPTDQETRLNFVTEITDADYYISNYYYETGGYGFSNEVFSVPFGNTKILSVYRLTDEDRQ